MNKKNKKVKRDKTKSKNSVTKDKKKFTKIDANEIITNFENRILMFSCNLWIITTKSQKGDIKIDDILIRYSNAILESCGSLLVLAQNNRARSFKVLSRVFFETILNCCYVMASKEANEKANIHALQKFYRDSNRVVTIDGTELQSGINGLEFNNEAIILDAVKQYSTKKGKEVRNWTNDNIEEKIRIISLYFKDIDIEPFKIFYFIHYRESSEIIHGTYYSILDWLRSFYKTNETTSHKEYENKELIHYLFGVQRCLYYFLEVLNYYDPERELKANVENWINQDLDIMKKIIKNASPPDFFYYKYENSKTGSKIDTTEL